MWEWLCGSEKASICLEELFFMGGVHAAFFFSVSSLMAMVNAVNFAPTAEPTKTQRMWNWVMVVLSMFLAVCPIVTIIVEGKSFPPSLYVWILCLLMIGSWSICAFVLLKLKRNGLSLDVPALQWWWVAASLCLLFRMSPLTSHVQEGGALTGGDIWFIVQYSAVLTLGIYGMVGRFRAKEQGSYELVNEEGVSTDSPEDRANWLSRVLFTWLDPVMTLGYKRPLQQADLPFLSSRDSSEVIYDQFEVAWRAEQTKPKPKLSSALISTFGKYFIGAAIFKFTQDLMMFVGPQILKRLIGYLSAEEHEPSEGYGYVLVLFVAALVQSIALHQYFQRGFRTGMNLRAAVIAAVYRKALKLSVEERHKRTVGEIVNLMSTDAMKLQELPPYLHTIWSAPFQITVSLIFLYFQVGISTLGGLAVMVCMIPLNTFLARKQRKQQQQVMKAKDERVRLTHETLNSIKMVKYSAWETTASQRIESARNRELAQLRKYMLLSAVSRVTWNGVPIIVSLATFALYTLMGNDLDAATAFTALALFNILRFPLTMLPQVITSLVEASVSIKRVAGFLACNEIDPDVVTRLPYESVSRIKRYKPNGRNVQNDPWVAKDAAAMVVIENGTFSWGTNTNGLPDLRNINLSVPEGALVCVVGSVGGGKSSLLNAILGEMSKQRGSVEVCGRIAYVSQTAFILNATLRENILFGRPFQEDRYRKTVKACCLLPDLAILPSADMTEIGEKGINLSGGQRQRINLARAVYANADLYLFDDPLSAVDAHVGKAIFENCINGVLKGKTRLLVTHAVHLLPQSDLVVFMRDGVIDECGTYQSLMDNPQASAFKAVVATSKQDSAPAANGQTTGQTTPNSKSPPRKISVDLVAAESKSEHRQLSQEEEERILALLVNPDDEEETPHGASQPAKDKGDATPAAGGPKLVKDEERATGSVKWSIYKGYINAAGGTSVLIITIALYTALQGASVLSNWWLSFWSSHRDENPASYFLCFYALFAFVTLALNGIQSILMTVHSIRAGKQMHSNLLAAILKAPLAFFDTTPLGRIIVRFSSDQSTIDDRLPACLNTFLSTSFSVMGTVMVIVSVTPWFLLVIAPLSWVYLFTQRYYVRTSRELQRLDSMARAPILSNFTETLTGTSTVRAYGDQDRFVSLNDTRVNDNLRAYFISVSSNRWLAIRLEFVGACIISVSALLAVMSAGYIDAALAGLSISYALSVTQTLNWMVRMSCDRETQIVSVERNLQYATTEPEAAYELGLKPPSGWPAEGRISLKNVVMRYRPGLPPVLNGLSVDIKAREKIGICGRTGAGKSSLMVALFRIAELSEGRIDIDGLNIAELGLHDLRSRLTIIMQEPVLFSGTMRYNLDPFGRYRDDELWSALKQVNLDSQIQADKDKLETVVAENGENWSVGQRQLICLARAFLRKSRIVVLDEATASVDIETDAFVQDTIRRMFSDCTVLTIAHRLNTIADSDRILVLDKGQIAEFDTPRKLLALPNGHYKSMMREHNHSHSYNSDAI
eukprot:GILK01007575.1.p1 GENE.GILK01007575.1~~GILK01007575.1.p1  ORF type:complete len:1529 (-),score=302.56 GILK01007575.1:186-4727(-)